MRTPESRLRWIARFCKAATAPFVRSWSFCAKTRARMSMPVPGVKGTTSLIGRDG